MSTTTYVIHTALAGLYMPSETEPFDATLDEAIAAFLDEADEYLDATTYADDDDEDDSMIAMDRAYIESLRGAEGRGDIAATLTTHGVVSLQLESPHNEFGATVTLAVVADTE